MRQELISQLIRHGLEVTRYNIEKLEKQNITVGVVKDLESNSFMFNKAGLNNVQDYIASLFDGMIDSKIKTRDKTEELRVDISRRIFAVRQTILALLEETATAEVLETVMSGEVKTLLMNMGDIAMVSDRSTNIKVMSYGSVADNVGQNTTSETSRIRRYSFDHLTASIRSTSLARDIPIVKVNPNGLSTLPADDEMVVNNDTAILIEAELNTDTQSSMEIIIDKNDSDIYNQIELGLNKAHIISIFTSADGEKYTATACQTKYSKTEVLTFSNTDNRFIKIVFHKRAYDKVRNGSRIHAVLIDYINISRSSYSGVATLIAMPLEVDGVYAKCAIDACDSISEGHDSIIDYEISINGHQWQKIRPVGRHSGNQDIPSIANIINDIENAPLDMGVGVLRKDGAVEYSLSLPEDFTASNFISMYQTELLDEHEWEEDSGSYTVIATMLARKEVDFGPYDVSINGQWASGKVDFTPGIYKMQISSENYSNIFLGNAKNATDVGLGEFIVTGSDNVPRTVLDKLYPYNHKYIIESNFTSVMRKELIENKDYYLYNSNSGYKMVTTADYGPVLGTHRVISSQTNSIQIRAHMKSKSHSSAPYINKILFRLA